MLTIYGNAARFCDGVSRRNFLKIGAIGLAGLSLPQILRAEAVAGSRNPHKAVIMIYLPGGPSHQDMFDLKPAAPSEIRGEFTPISTSVPGIQICEHLPRLAKMMDKLALLRAVVGSEGQHSSFQCLTGRIQRSMPPGGWPALGSCVAKLQGPTDPAVPPYIALNGTASARERPLSGFLGLANAPFSPSGPGKADMVLNGVSLDRLADRKALLTSIDRFRRDVDNSGMMDGLDAFDKQAMNVLTSSKLIRALDIRKEDPSVLERYEIKSRGGGNRSTDSFLLARRLVEAGARCVTLAFGGWDTHGQNFKTMRQELPRLDVGVSALVQDLHDRGLDKDVSVLMWGEFGRTPKINNNAGRDHWPKITTALMAGGGMKVGQVIGATDRDAGDVADRPVKFEEVFATLYHNLGLDLGKVTLPDLTGRPQYLTDGSMPIQELVG